MKWLLSNHYILQRSNFRSFCTNDHARIYDHCKFSTLLWNLHICLKWHHASYLINHSLATKPPQLERHSWETTIITCTYIWGCKFSHWKGSEKQWLLQNYVFQIHVCTNLEPRIYVCEPNHAKFIPQYNLYPRIQVISPYNAKLNKLFRLAKFSLKIGVVNCGFILYMKFTNDQKQGHEMIYCWQIHFWYWQYINVFFYG